MITDYKNQFHCPKYFSDLFLLRLRFAGGALSLIPMTHPNASLIPLPNGLLDLSMPVYGSETAIQRGAGCPLTGIFIGGEYDADTGWSEMSMVHPNGEVGRLDDSAMAGKGLQDGFEAIQATVEILAAMTITKARRKLGE